METLTKENFWDEMSQKYPKAMAHFLNWIDEYKKQNNWFDLFNAGTTEVWTETESSTKFSRAPKYHELPIAMQFGIFLEYIDYVYDALRDKGIIIPIAFHYHNLKKFNVRSILDGGLHIIEDRLKGAFYG